jgi:hypothetical protein
MTKPHPRVFDLLDQAAEALSDAKHAARKGDDQLVHVFTRKAMRCADLASWWHSDPKAMESNESGKEGSNR